MDKTAEYQSSALKNAQKAFYLLSTTYKLLKEPKTLLLITSHVRSSFIDSISALLFFERAQKNILPYHDNDESKLNAFSQYLVNKYNLQDYFKTIQKIEDLSKEHKESVIEFSRDRKYVMCSKEFEKIETLSEDDVKDYIRKAKEFISVIDNITA